MNLLLLATLGGGIGAGARFLVHAGMLRAIGPGFPWGTLLINTGGSFVMGIAAEAIARKLGGSPEARAFLMSGILGGFTTFSAFSLDFANLADQREFLLAGAYVVASVTFSIGALYLGVAIARWVAP